MAPAVRWSDMRYVSCVRRYWKICALRITRPLIPFDPSFHTFHMISKPSAEHGRSTLRLLAGLHPAYISSCPDKLPHTD